MRIWGNAPYGYRGVVKLEKVPAEQRILASIRKMRDLGYSLQRIADVLNAEGRVTRKGTPWVKQYVANALKPR